jgi:hypothetical protein
MLNESGAKTFFEQMHNMYVQPELGKRFGNAGIPNSFKIQQCRIKLPIDKSIIVEFNDEVGWEFENPILAPGSKMEIGKPIYLHEILSLGKILPPSVEGKRVAFIYLYWSGFRWECFVDFLPNQPDYDPNDARFKFDGIAIEKHLHNWMVEMTAQLAKSQQDKLRKIGLWTITSLMPYPLTKLIELVGTGNTDEAITLLINYCDPNFIDGLVETWKPISVFADRMETFHEAMFCHRHRKYSSSIYTLVPQIEGLITDWLVPLENRTKVKDWPAKERIDAFKRRINEDKEFELRYKLALESVVEFLKNSQPLQSFEDWLQTIDPTFPARHPVVHGKQVKDMFNEVNSIKVFLLLDTICQFMMFYEVRVLGKSLDDGSKSST